MIQNRIEKKIMWRHLDMAGIVFYPKYYEWIDGCSHLFFEKISLSLLDLWKERQLQFTLVNTGCEYYKPGRYHQDIIITTHLVEVAGKTISIEHIMSDKLTGTDMVKAREKRICLDASNPERFRAIEIPPDIRHVLEVAL